MLTGESIPVTKVPIPNTSQIYRIDIDRNHTLFAGTSVLQIRKSQKYLFLFTELTYNSTMPIEGAIAMVVRTGFSSAKGKLMSSILYPKPTTFNFNRDSYRFVGIMFILGKQLLV